ncbi:MAG: tetratricopeptide repeat protein [Opitutales bacterium]|nr:tetratricopeptide repeat protein [Opitutales bacterium]
MTDVPPQSLVDDAIFQFTLGEHEDALGLIAQALALAPDLASAWHAKAEIHFDRRDLDEALLAAEKALALHEDVHVHTSLSRIWMERGDKERAEHHGARARILGWKEQLSDSAESD